MLFLAAQVGIVVIVPVCLQAFDKTIDKAVFYERYFSYTDDLVLSGRPYKTITNTEIDIDKKAKYEYRGDR